MNNTHDLGTAELTRRIDPLRPQRVNPKRARRGKLHEWAEAVEEWLNSVIDLAPPIAAFASLAILIAVAASNAR